MRACGEQNIILFNEVNKFSNEPGIYYSIYYIPPPKKKRINCRKRSFFTDTDTYYNVRLMCVSIAQMMSR